MSRELAMQLRGLVSRAAVARSDDGGESQTLDVKIRYGDNRSGVEVLQPFGIASRPPAGGVVIVLAVGGDQGDLVALPAGTPGTRLGGLKEGEAAIYGQDGSRCHVKADGSVDVLSSKTVTAKVDDAAVTVEADIIRGKVGSGRFVATADYVKMRLGEHYVVVTADGIFSDVPIVVGPDPDPET